MLLHSAIIFIKDKFCLFFGGNVIKLNLIGEVENRAEVKTSTGGRYFPLLFLKLDFVGVDLLAV